MRFQKFASVALLGTFGIGLLTFVQTAPVHAGPPVATAPVESEAAYLQKLRDYRKQLEAIKKDFDVDKDTTNDANRKAVNEGLRAAIDGIDSIIAAHKAPVKK